MSFSPERKAQARPGELARARRALDRAEDISAKVMQAASKGQLAILVTDAAGVVIAGIRATGGLTQLQYRPQDGTWEFAGAFSGPEVLEGSYVLRNKLGTEPEPPEPADQPPDSPVHEQRQRLEHLRRIRPGDRPPATPKPLPPPKDPP